MPTTADPPPPGDPPAAAGVMATARIVAEPNGRGGTALPVLHSDGPFVLYRSRTASPHTASPRAEVTIIAVMSAPLGGDHLAIDVEVRPGAHLRIGSAAATVALPSRRGDQATYQVHLTVGEGAVLHWAPEPLISAAGSDLIATTRIRLTPGARLVLCERQILGRYGEPPGRLVSRLTAHHDGRPLLDQELAIGCGAPGWSGPAILGDHRALGQLLVVDPAFTDRPPSPLLLPDTATPAGAQAVLTPLAGPAVLVTALGPDALRVQDLLDHSLLDHSLLDHSLAACPDWAGHR